MSSIIIIETKPRRFDIGDRSAVLRAFGPGRENRIDFEGQGTVLSATDADLRTINERHSSQELRAGDVDIFERYVCSDGPLRRPLRFTKRALDRFAVTFTEGRTVLLDHDESRPIGATFAAEVVNTRVRGIQANWLKVRFYAVTKGASEQRKQDIQDVRTGVRKYDSIEVRGGKWELVEEEVDGKNVYFYLVDDDPAAGDRLEAAELSMVYLGAVYGAGSDKGAGLSAREEDPYTSAIDSEFGIRALSVPPASDDDPYAELLAVPNGSTSGSMAPASDDDPYAALTQ